MLTSSLSLALISALYGTGLAQPDAPSGPPDRELFTVEVEVTPPAPRSFRTRDDKPTTRRLTYFEANGMAIVNGDVIYSSVEEMRKATTGRKRAFSRFRSESQFLWTGGKIHYKWQSEDAKGAGRLDAWTEATGRWTNMLSFLEFIEHPPSNQLVDDIVTLVPTVGQRGCFSPIGKADSAATNQIMLDDNCGGAGTYTHELGHTLGLRHEHQRPDRDNYVTINCQNVWAQNGVPADCSQDHCTGYGCNFVKLAPSAADYSGPYDSLSLMHYSPYEFANLSRGIDAKAGVPQPQSHTFPTILDAKRVCDLLSPGSCKGVCGDGVVDAENGEECDDGNHYNGDGCSANCKREGGPKPPTSSSVSVPPGSSSTSLPPTRPSSSSVPSSSPSTPPSSQCGVASCSTGPVSGCDITTTCTVLGGATKGGKGQHMCACRAGYRASGQNAGDSSVQVRLPWAEQAGRVFVKPGVVCDQLCDDWQLGKDGCKEVKESDVCY